MAEKINEILNPVKFNSRVSVPTATGTDPSEVVNIEYFYDNSSKVDWENIDSEVHVINDHNVEIDGGLVVHGKTGQDLLVVQSTNSGNIESKCINNLVYEIMCNNEPYVDLDGTTSWINDERLSVPYWITFPITQGYSYRLQYDPIYSSGEMSLLTPNISQEFSCGYHLVLSATHEGDTLNKVSYTYTPSNSDAEWGYKGTLEFTADISGYAYIAMTNGTSFGYGELDPEAAEYNRWRVYETSARMSEVKINGDLEITGDLSFGAESHLVFGIIEGTDFIADHAKVKNAPVEDDDVVNKAYFDANKGGGSATLAAAGSETLPVYIDASGSASAISSLELNRYAVEGDASSNSIHRTILNCESLTMTSNETAPGCQSVNISDNGSISLGIPAVGHENTLNISGSSIQFDTPEEYGIYPSITLNGKKVLVEGDVESLPAGATEGAFLRYRNGTPVWENIPNAEDSTF